MSKTFATFVFCRILGWKMVGNMNPEIKKCVIIGAPHTSWHDFYIAILFRSMVGLQMNFIGKKSLFKSPFGFFFKAMGGVPVDRSKSANLVDAIVDIYNEKDEFRLAISPEGTRKKVEKWKTGFYHIAKNANVPIVMMTFDFGRKQVAISDPYFTSENKEEDFQHFYNFYEGVVGKIPEFS